MHKSSVSFASVTDVVRYLTRYPDSGSLHEVVLKAIASLKSKQATNADIRDVGEQQSVDVADLYAFRLSSNYYKKGAVAGIEESIASLRRESANNVTLHYVDAAHLLIAIWIDSRDSLVALMIFSADT